MKRFYFEMNEKEAVAINLLEDIIGERRQMMLRRIVYQELERASAYLDGEELELWLDLVETIEREHEYHKFEIGELRSEVWRQRKLKEGETPTPTDSMEADIKREKMRNYQRERRKKIKLQKLKEYKEKWDLEDTNSASATK